MSRVSEQAIVTALLERHGHTFADQLGIKVASNTPSALFRLLCAALLFSARIRWHIAVKAAEALTDKGWTTAAKMASSAWEERARTLNEAGYARYDERTSTMLGQTAQMLLDRYDGDLRNLRDEADRDPKNERKRLKAFKGIGDVGADIFFREAQVAWDELFPFADERALETAQELDLPGDAAALARLAGDKDFPRLVAALIRVRLEDDVDELLAEAGQ